MYYKINSPITVVKRQSGEKMRTCASSKGPYTKYVPIRELSFILTSLQISWQYQDILPKIFTNLVIIYVSLWHCNQTLCLISFITWIEIFSV